MANNHHAADHTHNHPPVKAYGLTFGGLTLLMILTVLCYHYDIGRILTGSDGPASSYINNAIALTIAILKASLVVMFFMGVKYSSKLVKLWAIIGFVTLPLMFIVFGDVSTRHWEEGQGWYEGTTDKAKYRSEVEPRFKAINEEKGHSEEGGEHEGAAEPEAPKAEH